MKININKMLKMSKDIKITIRENIKNTKENIIVPIFGIIIAELLMFSGAIFYGLAIHFINIIFIISIIIFYEKEDKIKNVLQSLILVILLRMINLSVPQFFNNPILQYSLIYGLMFIPIYYVIKNQQISSKDLGLDFNIKKIINFLPIGIFIGILMSIIEYKILTPISIIGEFNISNIIIMIIVMVIFVASVEEIIFRSILQTRIELMSSPVNAIILNGILFGIMHAIYGKFSEIIFAIIFGCILSYIFYKTKNLPFVVTIHGTASLIAFGIISKILI